MLLHVAYLHGRRVRLEKPVFSEIERILGVSRRMIGVQPERVEVMPLVLDIRSFHDVETHVAEYVEYLHGRLCQKMQASTRRFSAGKSVVEVAHVVTERLAQVIELRLDLLLRAVLKLIYATSGFATLIVGEILQAFQESLEQPSLPEKLFLDGFDSRPAVGGRDRIQSGFGIGDFLFVILHDNQLCDAFNKGIVFIHPGA